MLWLNLSVAFVCIERCKCSSIRNYIEGGTITAAGTEFCHSCVDIPLSSVLSFLCCFLVLSPKDSAFELCRMVQKVVSRRRVSGVGCRAWVLLLKFVCVDFVVVCPFGIASLSVIKCRQTENQVTHTPR